MIRIYIPNNNISERRYVLDIIFNEFLGLKYEFKLGSKDYEIVLKNSKTLTIKDTFFNKYPVTLEYLKEENIPKSIKELDLFAACFFMLTRWEEYVNKTRDKYNRFPASESLAYKEMFLDRPIVNELIESLKLKLLELDKSLIFKERKFELILTHDVDNLYFWKNGIQLIRIVLGDILKRRNLKLALNRIKEYVLVKLKKIQDPFDTFDWLMDKSEARGMKSRFYFMSGGVTLYDNNYKIDEPKALKLLEKIKKRGHIIGIHPSYEAYNDYEQFKKEKEFLEKVCESKIDEGREHYLRFEVPTTWQIWEDNGMKIDSTCGYAEKEGFRCGTGDEFSVFNILSRERLQLKERPLIVMDGSFMTYQKAISPADMERKIQQLINSVKIYNGTFTLLWHNSSFNTSNWEKYKKIYEKILG